MNPSPRSDEEELQWELDQYQSIAQGNRARLEQNPVLDMHLKFWFESIRFLITELVIWDDLGRREKYDKTFHDVRRALNHVHQLIAQLMEAQYRNHSDSEDVE